MRKEKILPRGLVLYGVFYLCLLAVFVCFFYYFFEPTAGMVNVTQQEHSLWQAIQIIINNLKNMIEYTLLFAIYPLLLCYDLAITTWSIVLSLHGQGISLTLRHLLLHGVVEVPNVICYTFLSAESFWELCRNRNFGVKEYFGKMYRNRFRYLICAVMVLVAGLIEGLVG